MTVHIMVDLETWGTTPGSDIRSIGAVVFDPVAGTLGDEFYVNVENRYWDDGGYCASGSWMKHPLTRDPSTEKWWSEQSAEAQQALLVDQVNLADGLLQFSHWWNVHQGETTTFWAHGPHFDEQILAACFRATGIVIPWSHRAPRDCRTIWEAAGGVEIPFVGTPHNALHDAKHQARCVIEAYRVLRMPVGLLRAAEEELRRAASHYADEGIGGGYIDCSRVADDINQWLESAAS